MDTSLIPIEEQLTHQQRQAFHAIELIAQWEGTGSSGAYIRMMTTLLTSFPFFHRPHTRHATDLILVRPGSSADKIYPSLDNEFATLQGSEACMVRLTVMLGGNERMEINFRANGTAKKILALVLSLGLVILMKCDISIELSLFLIALTAVFIYLELFFIKSTIVRAYSEALTENRIILFFIGHRFINFFISAFFSIYMSFYLFIHINIAKQEEIGFYFVSGFLLSALLVTAKKSTEYFFKNIPAKAFFRLSLVFTVVFITAIVDGLYNSIMPIDSRITEMFDKDIPLYVIEDVEHSFVYLQHLLRTTLYFKLNIQSIEKYEDIGEWVSAIKFILLLTPTPYIAYSLLYLSFISLFEKQTLMRANNV